MRDFIRVILGIFVAFFFYTILSKISPSLIHLFNIFSLVVIYFAIEKGEVFGAGLGTTCGLVQDYFSSGVFGIAGLAKTVTGYLAGYISKKIDVYPLLRSFLFIFILTVLELILWALLNFFILPEGTITGRGPIYFQPLVTAFLGSLLFFLTRKIKKSEV